MIGELWALGPADGRFGDATSPGDFLSKWTDALGNFVYPPFNGFQLDTSGKPINGSMMLEVGGP